MVTASFFPILWHVNMSQTHHKHELVGGFNPSEKYEFVSWDDYFQHMESHSKFHGSIHHQPVYQYINNSPNMGMDQYLLIPFLMGWTSIYQLFWCSPGVYGFDTLPHQFSIVFWDPFPKAKPLSKCRDLTTCATWPNFQGPDKSGAGLTKRSWQWQWELRTHASIYIYRSSNDINL